MAALAAQTRPADAVLAADTGSTDESLTLLERVLGAGSVIAHAPARGGFGAAVKAVVDQLAPGGRSMADQEWLWLLHDDAAPAPDALAELLKAVERAPSVTVAGCKQLDWYEPRKLVDVGLSTSRWAERLTLIDHDEQDQGQYDGRSDVVAVNSAGMLIRRDVWDQLGGFDPALPGTGDDVDFCWRSRLAGHRVVVVPKARMFHVAHRPAGLATVTSARKAEVHLRLKHAPWWQVPFLAMGALLGGLFRLVAGIVLKDPGHGLRQFLASCAALLRPLAVLRGRSAAARTRRLSRSVMKGLQTRRREVWAYRRSLLESQAGNVVGDGTGVDASPDLVPSGDAADDFASLATANRLWSGTGALASAGLLLLAALLSLFRLLGATAVAGGALLPLSDTLGQIWNNASTWWVGVGAGLPGHGDPFGYVLWLLAAAGFSHGSTAVLWLLVLALPLAGFGAWFASGALTRLRWPRFLAALVWAAAPALQVALGQGRLGALLAHLLIPWVALGFVRAVGGAVERGAADPSSGHGRSVPGAGRRSSLALPLASGRPGSGGTPSWTAAAAAGLGLAAAAAAAPVLLIPAVIVVVLATVLLGRRGRTLWWALLPSAALFVPFVLSALPNPRALLADPGVPLAYINAPLWQQLLGQPVSISADAGINALPWFPPGGFPWALAAMFVVGAPVLLLALTGLLFSGRRPGLVRSLWLVALLSLAMGYASGAVATALGGSSLVTPFSGPSVSVTAFALLGAAVLGLDALVLRARQRGPAHNRAARVTATTVSVLLLISPVASLSLWTAGNLLQHTGQTHSTGGQDTGLAAAQDSSTDPGASSSTAAATADEVAASPAPASGQYGLPALIRPSTGHTLPATATDRGNGPEQTRTLVIGMNADGTVSAALMRGAGTTLDSLSTIAAAHQITGAPGAEALAPDDGATTAIRRAVATIIAGTGVDPRPDLSQLGVGFVVLQQGDTRAELMASQIEAVPGLATVGPTEAGWLWRVTPEAVRNGQVPEVGSRARIVDASGAILAYLPSGQSGVDAAVPAGPEGRLLVLAERADDGWSASIDGKKLTSVSAGWSQAFTLPAGGGNVQVNYRQPWAPFWNAVQIVVLGLTVLLAIPMPAPRRRKVTVNGRRTPPAQMQPQTSEAGTAEVPLARTVPAETPEMAGTHG